MARRLVISLLSTVLLLAAGAWWAVRRDAHRLSQALAVDVAALEERTLALPSGQPGSLTACLARQSDSVPEPGGALAWAQPEVMAVAAGAGLETLTPGQREALEAMRPWFEATVACGRLRRVDLQPGLGPFADYRSARRQNLPQTMDVLTAMTPLALRDAPPDQALAACADVLALSVAWLRLEGLESMLPVLGPLRSAEQVCARTLPLASEAAQVRFHGRMRDISALAPDAAELIRIERAQSALRLFGAWVPAEVDQRLSPDARFVTATQRASKWDRGVTGTLALRFYWKRYEAGMREVEAACRLPLASRAAAIVTAQQHLEAPFLSRFFSAEPVDLRYQMYVGSLDALRADLERWAE